MAEVGIDAPASERPEDAVLLAVRAEDGKVSSNGG